MLSRRKEISYTALMIGLGFVFAFLLVELMVELVLSFPSSVTILPKNVQTFVKNYYLLYDRNLIQLNPDCSQYDKELFYTLRPGECLQQGREYGPYTFRINSKGMRDDEASLTPTMLVLGDSFAMGFGVDEGESFPDLIEKREGYRVLNAGISSYGTAREAKLASRIDTSKLKYLVIQYCYNDYEENESFLKMGDLEITPEDFYDNLVVNENKERTYYLGKRSFKVLQWTRHPLGLVTTPPAASAETQAKAFLDVLMKALHIKTDGLRVIVLETNSYNNNSGAFAEALRRLTENPALPPHLRLMKVLDVSKVLTNEDYYFLDDHLNRLGHKKIANVISDTAADLNWSP